MTRLLSIAAVALALAGCRSSCGAKTSQAAPAGGCNSAVPVSCGTPVMSYPASYSTVAGSPVVARPVGSFPVITPPANATELPFPAETIPPTMLPTGPVMALPNGSRSVGLPK